MIAARRGNHAADLGSLFGEPVDINQTAPKFEGTGGRVIFVFDPGFRTAAFTQQRPTVYGGGADCTRNEFLRLAQAAKLAGSRLRQG